MAINSSEVNIVLTGGHGATTALSVVSHIKQNKNWNLFWIGSKFAFEGSSTLTLEAQVFPKEGVNFLPILAGRLQPKFSRWTIPSLAKIPIGFIQSFFLLLRIKPKVVLSFGGFAAYPVVFCSFILGIPVVVHEQTAGIGRANKASLFFAKVVALSREESRKFIKHKKIVLTGNPINPEILRLGIKRKIGNPATVFVTGGSRGSHRINSAIFPILNKLLREFVIIHQTGEYDFKLAQDIRMSLEKPLQDKYSIFSIIEPSQMPSIFGKSDIIVTRGGANTVSEILSLRRPSIIIPIPWSEHDEQRKNAAFLEKAGLGIVIDQNEFTPDVLLSALQKIKAEWIKRVNQVKFSVSDLDKTSSQKIVQIIQDLVNEN